MVERIGFTPEPPDRKVGKAAADGNSWETGFNFLTFMKHIPEVAADITFGSRGDAAKAATAASINYISNKVLAFEAAGSSPYDNMG